MRKTTQTDYVKTALRLPPELHKKLHDATASTGRSLNAEIISRLELTFYLAGVKAGDENEYDRQINTQMGFLMNEIPRLNEALRELSLKLKKQGA